MKAKNENKKWLGLMLVVLMFVSMISMSAFAAEKSYPIEVTNVNAEPVKAEWQNSKYIEGQGWGPGADNDYALYFKIVIAEGEALELTFEKYMEGTAVATDGSHNNVQFIAKANEALVLPLEANVEYLIRSNGYDWSSVLKAYIVHIGNKITVIGGNASATNARPGQEVTLTANAAPKGKVFDKWIVSGATVAKTTSSTTTFVMADEDVTAKATYKDCTHAYDDVCDTVCNICSATREAIHDLLTLTKRDSTCTSVGYTATVYRCKACDAMFNHEKVQVTIKEFSKYMIPRKSHKMNYVPDSAPTCTEPGLYAHYECTMCGMFSITEDEDGKFPYEDFVMSGKPALGHRWNSGKVTKPATTAANGVKTHTCTASGCGATKTSTIYKASGVKLSTASYTYNGKTKSPKVYVKDSKGNTISSSNYTISIPSGRKNVGQYTYKITFKNQYSGTKSLTLKINPKGTSISKLSKAKKAFTVKWKKQSDKMKSSRISGYQIQYSTSKKFTSAKTKTVSGYKSTSKKITSLKAKKTYYVRVRTYKTVKVSGKSVKLYSGWSKVKSVKTK